ncbi:MAG TPA: type II toxin-antitoxin system RelE/ParE family toxin [Anaerolineae bacterium]|nr:type II toxin-antitoxin system RelE/ParE family toxin [Anaerolineae bacterium]
MKIEFKRSFARDLRKLPANQRRRVEELILRVESAESIQAIPNLRTLQGAVYCYRIRQGKYRCGVIIEEETVLFVRYLHRREIYRHFP